jgi:hypothetical protein
MCVILSDTNLLVILSQNLTGPSKPQHWVLKVNAGAHRKKVNTAKR